MNDIYLYKSGTLKKKDYSLILITDSEEILIPIEQVKTIYCCTSLTINTKLLEFLNKKDIAIYFFDYYGRLSGRFLPARYSIGEILSLQFQFIQTPELRLKIAKEVQRAAFTNMINLLKYYLHKKSIPVDSKITSLSDLRDEIQSVSSIESLLLLEARAKKVYYSSFDQILDKSPFQFVCRTKRPPENPVNAMMSYGNALLYSSVLAEIDRSPLIPELSFIHSIQRPGPSLHLDLADIYKPVLIDRLIFRLVAKNEIHESNFSFQDEQCLLNQQGLQIFVSQYHQLLKETILVNGRHLSYQSIIKRDLYNLLHIIEGKEDEFKPFNMKW